MAEYREIGITGRFDLVRGFVVGFLAGRAFPAPALFSHESGMGRARLGERVLGWTGVLGHAAYVVVDGRVADDLVREIVAREAELDLKVSSDRRIQGATLDFHYRVFGKAYAREIQGLFRSIPEGLEVRYESKPEETVDPGARGVELYSPEHEYEYSARGSVSGDFAGVHAFFETLVRHPLVEVGEVRLEYADVSGSGG
jgi:hypothetical protein